MKSKITIGPFLALLTIPLMVALFGLAVTAMAQPSSERSLWFKSLTQPGTGQSCCDIADCMKTSAEWRDGQWWADVRGTMKPIPPERVLKTTASIDGAAYVCSNPAGQVLCFVPPSPGS